MTNNILDLSVLALSDWVLVNDIKQEVAAQLGIEISKVTQRLWKTIVTDNDLETRNIGGKWHARYARDEETVTQTDTSTALPEPTPTPVKPCVVSFGDFSNSLAVVNTGDITVTNTQFNSGALADEAGSFVSQLGAFGSFLENTSRMLDQRKADLERNTEIKRNALAETQLQVETIRQKVVIAQKESIGTRLENEALDSKMNGVIDLGKSLHSVLSSLD